MFEFTGNRYQNLIQDIDSGYAVEVKRAAFFQGEEDEIVTRFYRLWGEIIRAVHNRSTTCTRYYRITGSDKFLFNAHYPE